MVKFMFMQDKPNNDRARKKERKDNLPVPSPEKKPFPEKTEVKNANAAGLGAIGRTGEKPGPDMDENMHY
jgi:hypothetical protein